MIEITKKKILDFFNTPSKWHDEYNLLRKIILEFTSLEEDFKWMHPCYTLNDKNVVLIHGFKDYCALLFHKGALLKDPSGILIQQTKNVQSARQIRFKTVGDILNNRHDIENLITEAITVEKEGKIVKMKKLEDFPIPEEFQKALSADQEFNRAFSRLTPGRQRGYLYFFNQAKKSETRLSRIEKYYQQIIEGKGLDD